MDSSIPTDTVTEAAPNRLRDLRGRDRLLAIGLLILVLVPFVVSLVRAYQHHWIPSGDDANIATRALDVFSRHPPLTGLPSTTGFYGQRIFTQHPGPFEFYLLAMPIRVLGAATGSLLTAATINAAFVVVALWTIYRRVGLSAMLGAGVIMQAVLWSGGTAVLSEPLSSNMTMYSMLCTAVLAWALADGDYRLLPLTAIVASYAAQQHLAADLVVAPLVIVGCILLAIRVTVDARRGITDERRPAMRFAVGAAIVSLVCWIPVIWDEVTGHPGNLTAIVRFARDNSRPTLGFNAGVRQLVHAIAPPTLLSMSNITGTTLTSHVGTTRAIAGFVTAALLVLVMVLAFRNHRSLARFAGITLVLLGAGVVNGSNVPTGVEAIRAAEYRWTWAAAFMTWTTLGWALAVLVRPRARLHAAAPAVPIAFLLIVAIIGVATITTSGADDAPSVAGLIPLERQVDRAVLAHVDHRQPIVVLYRGSLEVDQIAYQLVFRLVEAGYDVQLPPSLARALGGSRPYRASSMPMAIILTRGEARHSAGALVTEAILDRPYVALLDELAADAARAPVTLAPDAEERANRLTPGSFEIVRDLPARYRDNQRALLAQPTALTLILKGVFRAPSLDRTKLRRLAALEKTRPTVLGGEPLTVTALTPAQIRAHPPYELSSRSAP